MYLPDRVEQIKFKKLYSHGRAGALVNDLSEYDTMPTHKSCLTASSPTKVGIYHELYSSQGWVFVHENP